MGLCANIKILKESAGMGAETACERTAWILRIAKTAGSMKNARYDQMGWPRSILQINVLKRGFERDKNGSGIGGI